MFYKDTNKLSKSIYVISLFFFLSSLFMQLYFSNKYTVKNDEIGTYIQKRHSLEQDISKLELEVAQLSSLSFLEARAQKLGFVRNVTKLGVIALPSLASASYIQ